MDEIISITIDDAEVRALLDKLQAKVGNLSPVMRNVSHIMRRAVEKQFASGGRARSITGSAGGGTYMTTGKWPISGRAKKSLGQTLIATAQMATGVEPGSNALSAWVTSNRGRGGIISATHQFGTNRAGRKHNIKIPARPFLALGEDDMQEIKEAIEGYLTGR